MKMYVRRKTGCCANVDIVIARNYSGEMCAVVSIRPLFRRALVPVTTND